MRSAGRVLAVGRKEVWELLRDPITLGIAIVLPLMMMVLFTYAITLDVRAVPLAILDEDGSPDSREYVDSILRSGYFKIETVARDIDAVQSLLDRGAVRVGLVIPAGFARSLDRGLPADIQTLLDGSFSNTAIIAGSYLDAISEGYMARLQERALAARVGGMPRREAAVRVEARVLYNPALQSAHYVVPGLFVVILMAFPPLLTALAVVRERERGSILQIRVSPLRAWEFLAGKLLPYSALAFVEMLLLLAAGHLWFGAPVRGSIALLLALSAVYVLCTVGIGLVVSTLTRSQVVAILLSIVLTLMPSFLFSGFLFPIESMPAAVRGYTYLFPARYFMEISRGISLKGLALGDLWPEAAILLLYAATLLAIASVAFPRARD